MVNSIKIKYSLIFFISIHVCLFSQKPARAFYEDQALLSEIISAMKFSSQIINMDSLHPQISAKLADTIKYLGKNFPLVQEGTVYPEATDFKMISRFDRQSYNFKISRLEYGPSNINGSLQYIKWVSNQIFTPELDKIVGKENRKSILAPVTELSKIQLEVSLMNSLERLRRYEIKYGPHSARLNILETVVNLGMQGLYPFGPDETKGPGPLEIVLSYSSSYLMVYNIENREFPGSGYLVSMAEIGLRNYVFKPGWGEGNILKPAYFSLGLTIAAPQDGALRLPFFDDGENRLGVFCSWGSLKLAYIGGENSRLLVSRQFQLIPFAF